MTAGSVLFGYLAGVLSTLSPCVLPLLPLVFGGAASGHRHGPLALAGGLVTSFVGVGLFVALAGYSIGLDGDVFRTVAALVLAALGAVLLAPPLQARFAAATAGFASAANTAASGFGPGLAGQFGLGVVLGAVWSPCVGPTLGAASTLAAQGRDIPAVAAVMLAFGAGAATPLLLVARLSRAAMQRWRGRMMGAGETGKKLLGAAALAIGLMILTGLDHRLEAAIVAASPNWLIDLTARF